MPVTTLDTVFQVSMDAVNDITGDRWTVETIDVETADGALNAQLMLRLWAALHANRLPVGYVYDFPIPRPVR